MGGSLDMVMTPVSARECVESAIRVYEAANGGDWPTGKEIRAMSGGRISVRTANRWKAVLWLQRERERMGSIGMALADDVFGHCG